MPSAAKATSWLFKMSHEKQDTLLKMTVLTMASILCEYSVCSLATFYYFSKLLLSLSITFVYHL